jgi:alpha-tubulin suppressor-like RCC1 family protein
MMEIIYKQENKFSVGYKCAAAITPEGTVVSWGKETNLPSNLKNMVAVSCGYSHTAVLTYDGTVMCWGNDRDRRYTVPEGLECVVAISCSGHTAVVTQSGKVVCWGHNFFGQCNVPDGLDVTIAVSCGAVYTAALTQDGAGVLWGGDILWGINVNHKNGNLVLIYLGDLNYGWAMYCSRLIGKCDFHQLRRIPFCGFDAGWESGLLG